MATTHRVRPLPFERRTTAPPGPDLTFTVRPCTDPHGTLVAVAGDVDLATADDLQRTLSAVVSIEQRTLVVDLAAVDFFDCSGLRVLSRMQRAMNEQGGRLEVTSARPLVARLLALSELDHLLPTAT
jgi:anti-sigma B factor antagonist